MTLYCTGSCASHASGSVKPTREICYLELGEAGQMGKCRARSRRVAPVEFYPVAMFEKASEAVLNLQKSIAIPMGGADIPDWLENTRHIVANPGERFRYFELVSGTGRAFLPSDKYTAQIRSQYYEKG
ncbi:hypothetical protein R1sor_026609 [Riccia sorocarpa]|uniref:Uncharacterized protein n=1 Tax=Riccia sorocarpa TaxID=122646 RepID=A0ABD3GFJ0_9MARC